MKNPLFVLFCILLQSGFAVAQQGTDQDKGEELPVIRALSQGQATGANMILAFEGTGPGTEGHPFYENQWLSGWVQPQGGRRIENLQIKFDVTDNRVFVRRASKVIELEIASIAGFGFQTGDGKALKYRPVSLKGSTRFMHVLHESAGATVLQHDFKKFYRGRVNSDGYTAAAPDRYEARRELWVERGGTLYKAGSGVGSVSKAFGVEPARIKVLVREKQLDLAKADDLVQLAVALAGV